MSVDQLRLIPVRQTLIRRPLAGLAAAVATTLRQSGMLDQIAAGARIAVGAGSRGISRYAEVVAAVVATLREAGAHPFIVPAMGSHGGATATGQLAVLRDWGIDEAAMGCPVISSMHVVALGHTPAGVPVFCDAAAYASDGIIVVNRVKPHTDFHGATESGLTKMLAIGLGKREGAEAIHRRGAAGLREDLPAVAAAQVRRAPVLGGVAIIEDGAHAVSEVVALPATAIARAEPALLDRARAMAPALPFAAADVLVVDWMGKDISGTGMDTTVIGRRAIDGEPEPETPRIGTIAALRLTPASHGNAAGIGLADVVSRTLAAAMDAAATGVNVATSGFPRRGVVPAVADDDRHTLMVALQRAGVAPTAVRLARISDTLSLEQLLVSAALLDEVCARPGVVRCGEACAPLFDAAGRLTDLAAR